MKTSGHLFVLAAIFAVTVASVSKHDSLSAQEEGKGPALPLLKWEYKIQTFDNEGNEAFENKLNRLGDEGWELGGTVSTVTGGNTSPPLRLIFKRAKR